MKSRIALVLLLFPILASAQTLPKPEFRGVWIATVANLDWPTSRTASPAQQQADLIDLLDKLKSAGTNAVFFQVRTEADALYPSSIEPWSTYLTGTEGVAPNPLWDPLAFAIEESHKRGMELHAWLNPYRADRAPGSRTRAANHVTVTNPEWIITATSASSSIKIMDPGLPQVRERVTAVVMDIIRRYDVDGIHFDDYFYPYPPNDMSVGGPRDGLDNATFATYGAGFTSKAAWRRNNVDIMVKAVHDSIKAAKPHVKFGISPFGIWKNGVPSGITGMDAYNVIFADAPAWLEQRTVDYLTPQLYWKYGGGQDYGKLAPWWAAQTNAAGRHIYQGLAPYRLPPSSGGGQDWPIGDLTRQIQYNQSDPNTQGQIMFRARSISGNIKSVADTLRRYYYESDTFTPRAGWLPTSTPPAPVDLITETFVEGGVTKHRLTWKRPEYSASSSDTLLLYLITKFNPVVTTKQIANDETQSGHFVSVMTGQTTWVDHAPYANTQFRVYSVARNGSVSEQSASAITTSLERDPEIASGIRLEQNYPNPFNPETVIGFQLSVDSDVDLSVFDVLGRRLAVLAQSRMPAGAHSVTFDASALSSGVYLYVLSTGDERIAKRMTLVR